jgi:hypothetical protein
LDRPGGAAPRGADQPAQRPRLCEYFYEFLNSVII